MSLEENLRELEGLRRILEGGIAFGQEVRRARTGRGMTLDGVAAATGIAKSYLSQIETGYAPPPRDEKVRKIARALGLDEEALVAQAHLSQLPEGAKERIARLVHLARLGEVLDSTEEVARALLAAKGEGAPGGNQPGGQNAAAGAGDGAHAAGAKGAALDLDALHRSGLLHHLAEWGADRVDKIPSGLRRVPIINKVAAGYPQEFTDLGYPVGIADDYVTVPAEMGDPSAFAVRVVGDSMEPRYHEGDIVILSPAAQVRSGDDCFVRFAMAGGLNEGEATFKRVFFDAEDRVRLQALNERYAPSVVRPADIAGVFRAVARYEKL
ncbi:MAG: helix-turn-helix domain-containing protein [Planctomycetes bacterium]|nr:helix-turn-helix domain-containing protein [Planctomycetota bacterium]